MGAKNYSRSRHQFPVSNYQFLLVPVMLRLIRPFLRDPDVIRLVLGQLRELDAELVQVEPGDLFVEQFGQHVHAQRVLVELAVQCDLRHDLVGEAR